MKEFIICAAIHYDDGRQYEEQPEGIDSGFIIQGRRHKDCYQVLKSIGIAMGFTQHTNRMVNHIERANQGFMTSTNRYVSRAEAFKIAQRENQIHHKLFEGWIENDLVSEDLY